MNWTSRKQWTLTVGSKETARVEITITRLEKDQWYSWWLDPAEADARPWYCQSPTISLTEAKRRSVQDAEAFVARLVAARGGG